MKIIETLDWILDKNDKRINGEEEYLLNIEFVHSLGLKCDYVGWSTLDLQNPRADEILSAIDSFCSKRDLYKEICGLHKRLVRISSYRIQG